MKNNYLRYNSTAALILRIVEIVSGLILPRFFLLYFGSETNGLVSSISQFLGVISFLDMGTTAVVVSSLYRPIAQKNQSQIDSIISAANNFFKKIAYVLVIYVVALCFLYPFIIESSLDNVSTVTLIAAMAIGTFAQYYTGIVDQIFLTANQKEYIYSSICAFTIILNTILSVILMRLGASIQTVKFFTSILYLIRPLFIRIYIKHRYNLNRNVSFSKDTIPQRWNGVAQHIAFQILTGTDTIVLTLLSSLGNVSVYAVYNMVLNGVASLLKSLTNGIKPRLGLMWAEKNYKEVELEYKWYEWLYHLGISFVFGCVLILLVPFVMTYTSGVDDVNYERNVFAAVITIAYAAYSMAQFGIVIVQAVNHYKQTQKYYIISAVINVILSVLLVAKYGLVGVSIGTLVAMLFQYGWSQWYMAKKLFHSSIWNAFKQLFADAIVILLGWILLKGLKISDYNYISWLFMAIRVAIVYIAVTILVNSIFYPRNIRKLFLQFLKK